MTLPALLSIALACNPASSGQLTGPEEPPPAPTNLTASPASSQEIEGSFSPSSEIHDGFRVYRNAGQGERVHLELGPDDTTFVDARDVSPGQAYVYRVRAYNAAGESAPSNLVEVDLSSEPPGPSRDVDALLTGMTPGDMTVPDGWRLHRTEDFENWDSGNFSKFSTADVATDRAHTGSHSMANTIAGDGQQNGGSMGNVSGREVYVSWYEFVGEEARFNTEFRMAHVLKRDPFQEIVINFRVAGQRQGFNSEIGNYIPIAQGKHSNAYHGDALKNVERPRGKWVQYEWRVRANTPGAADGEYDFWRDGELLVSMRNVVLNGDRDMTGMRPVVGGTYTKHNWMKRVDEACVEGQYIGDGGSYRGHPCLEPNTDIPVRCKSFSQGCEVGPTPPIFRHWIDDVIVLER